LKGRQLTNDENLHQNNPFIKLQIQQANFFVSLFHNRFSRCEREREGERERKWKINKSTVHQYSTTGTWRLDSTSWNENKKREIESNERKKKIKIGQFPANSMRGGQLQVDSRLFRDVQTSVWSLFVSLKPLQSVKCVFRYFIMEKVRNLLTPNTFRSCSSQRANCLFLGSYSTKMNVKTLVNSIK